MESGSGYYTYIFESDTKPETIYFDYVYVDGYSLDVQDADGFDLDDQEGPEYTLSGSFDYECEDDIDWESFDMSGFELQFYLGKDNKEIEYDTKKAILTLYNDKDEKLEETITY